MSKWYEDECCDCATGGYPCRGSSCSNRNVMHLKCDDCKDEVNTLYLFEGEELCEECLISKFEKIEV